MRPLFIKKSMRSKLYEESNDIFIIFNADDLLTDFNNSARIFFGFTKKDIYNLSLQNFIKDYVPLGNVPSDSFSGLSHGPLMPHLFFLVKFNP